MLFLNWPLTITAAKKRISLALKATVIKDGQKLRLLLKLSRKDRQLIDRALAKHQKVAVAILATVSYPEGRAKAGPLGIKLVR